MAGTVTSGSARMNFSRSIWVKTEGSYGELPCLSELSFYNSLSQWSFCWTYICFLGSPLNECLGNSILSLMDSESLPVQMTVCEHMCIIEICPVPAHLEATVPLLNMDLSCLITHNFCTALYPPQQSNKQRYLF